MQEKKSFIHLYIQKLCTIVDHHLFARIWWTRPTKKKCRLNLSRGRQYYLICTGCKPGFFGLRVAVFWKYAKPKYIIVCRYYHFLAK